MDPDEIRNDLLVRGLEKARAQAYFTSRDRYRKQVRAKWTVHHINAGNTVGKSEQLALLEPEYIKACEEAEEAEEQAGAAAVEYEAVRSWFDAMRTLEATKRAEMTLR